MPSRRVSIFASQGPPDRPQVKNGQNSVPPAEQRRASFHPEASFGAARLRGDWEQATDQAPDAHNSAAQFFETGSKSSQQGPGIGGPSSMVNSRHSMAFPQSQAKASAVTTGQLGQPDQLEDDALFPSMRVNDSPSDVGLRSKDLMAGLKPSSDRPSGRPVSIKGTSSYSQYAAGLKKPGDTLSLFEHDQSSNVIQRTGSNNSARKESLQPHAVTSGVSYPTVPVSRTASDASQSTEKGSASVRPSPLQIPPSHGPASSQPAPMAHTSPASRPPHESAKLSNPQTFVPSHTHSQSLPTLYPYSASGESKSLSRAENNSSSRSAANRASTSYLHPAHAYPIHQQSSTQDSKGNYTPSSNVSYSAQARPAPQSQQSLSTTKQYAMHPNMPLTQQSSLHSPSDMLSSQNVDQPLSPMYHNLSDPRNNSPLPPQTPNPRTSISLQNPAQDTISKSPQVALAANSDSPTSGHRYEPPALEGSARDGYELGFNSTPPKVLESKQQSLSLPPPSARAMAPSLTGRPRSSAEHGLPTQHASSQAPTPGQATRSGPANDSDSPPGLTPSSSKESLDEVLMTPASLHPGRVQAQPSSSSSTDTLQRTEKKKGGFLSMFRSTSKQGKERGERGKEKELNEENLKGVNVKAEVRAYEAKTPLPYASQARSRPESIFKGRSRRPASIMDVFAPQTSNSTKATKPAKHVPPPIAIPSNLQQYQRLVSNKTKHYRSVSIASQEALDGTAVCLVFHLIFSSF